MKKLQNKMIVGALVGVIALGGLLQVGGVGSVAHASSAKKVSVAKEMESFIKSQRHLFVLQKFSSKFLDSIQSRSFNNLDEFKEGVVKLNQGWYLVHVGASHVVFWKK